MYEIGISTKSTGTDVALLIFSWENGLKFPTPVHCDTDAGFAQNFGL